MFFGLIRKTLRDVAVLSAILAAALAGLECLLSNLLARVFGDFAESLLSLPLMRQIITGFFGAEIGQTIGPHAVASIAWIHPTILALLWAHAIVFWTRMPAGEIDHGTIDVLLSLPVSRWRIVLCESVAWLVLGACLIAAGWAGNAFGAGFVGTEYRMPPQRIAVVAINLLCLYFAIGGVVCCVSSLSSRRGRAVGGAFALVLVMHILSFLAQIWDAAQQVSFLSLLSYYRPVLILRDGVWPVSDMLILVAVGAIFWLAGAATFVRRDICTV